MSTVAETRAKRRVDQQVARLERDLEIKRDQVERYYRRNCLLESLVNAQTTLLNALRHRDQTRIGQALEKIIDLRHQLSDDS